MKYNAAMHVKEFPHLRNSMKPVNEAVKEIGIELSFNPTSIHKRSMYLKYENIWDRNLQMNNVGKSQVDEMKSIFGDKLCDIWY